MTIGAGDGAGGVTVDSDDASPDGSRMTTILSTTRVDGLSARKTDSPVTTSASTAATVGQIHRVRSARLRESAPAWNISRPRSSLLGTGDSPLSADSIGFRSGSF